MRQRRNPTAFFVMVAVCGCLAIYLDQATAQDQAAPEQSVLIPPQVAPAPALERQNSRPGIDAQGPATEQPTLPPPFSETIPPQNGQSAVVVNEPVIHPAPPIVTHASLRARRMYRCHEQVSLVMATMDPVTCCVYEIPLCVPACCTGVPTISSRSGLLGRGVVEYCWPCGFTVNVKFRHILGDVKVEYDG